MRTSGPIIGLVALITMVVVVLLSAWTTSLHSDVSTEAARATGGGNPQRGREVIRHYGCNACHTIPGVTGARGLVGPPLSNIGSRVYIAGEVPNTPANLMRWIEHPHAIEPHTVMPEMGVTDQDARDIAAYLYTLR